MTDTTVLIPTFNEGGNVAELVRQLEEVFDGETIEILFVDDSNDDTPEIIRQVASRSTLPVRLIHRRGAERIGGLSGAVTTGLHEAHGKYVIVMDGDLQHPPRLAPVLRETCHRDNDVVVASRYCGDGDAAGLSSGMRRAVSNGSTLLSRTLFPRRVGRRCTDPMTGFFCVRRNAIDLDKLHPRGFKILLEILVSHDVQVEEIPFTFGERLSGASKASWRNGVTFLGQLLSLRIPRSLRFALVGAFGLVVNLAVLYALIGMGTNYVLGSILATEVAIASNFLMQERFVFHDKLHDSSHVWRHRLWRVVAYNNVDNAVRIPLLILLVERAHLDAVLAQAITLVVSFTARFYYTSRMVYRPRIIVVPEQRTEQVTQAEAA